MRKTWMGLLAAAVIMTGVNLSAQSSKPISFGIALILDIKAVTATVYAECP